MTGKSMSGLEILEFEVNITVGQVVQARVRGRAFEATVLEIRSKGIVVKENASGAKHVIPSAITKKNNNHNCVLPVGF